MDIVRIWLIDHEDLTLLVNTVKTAESGETEGLLSKLLLQNSVMSAHIAVVNKWFHQ